MTIPSMSDTKAIKILLVDDDEGDAKAVQRAFATARIANPFSRAIDGIDALEILRGENGKEKIKGPLIMLVDLNMPRMNGIELVSTIRRDPKLHQTIVFVLTTSLRDEDMTAAYNLNVAGYIVKERAGEDFLRLLSLIDSYWRIVELP